MSTSAVFLLAALIVFAITVIAIIAPTAGMLIAVNIISAHSPVIVGLVLVCLVITLSMLVWCARGILSLIDVGQKLRQCGFYRTLVTVCGSWKRNTSNETK